MLEKCDFIGEMSGKVETTFQPFLYLCTTSKLPAQSLSDNPGSLEVA